MAWELVSELRGCLVDKMQQEDLQVPLSSHFLLKFCGFIGFGYNRCTKMSEQAVASNLKKEDATP